MNVDTPQMDRLEDLCRAALEVLGRSVVLCRRDVLVYVNPAAARALHASAGADLVGKPVNDILHPDFREAAELRRRVLAQSQQVMTGLPAKLLGQDGSTIPVTVECRPFATRDGVVLPFTWETSDAVEGAAK